MVSDADIANLKYFRKTSGKIAGVPVDISRTGYTGDLGYEIWIPWNDAVKVWDELMAKGKQFDIHAAGMLALDVARVEAGLLLIEVDYSEFEEGADSRRRNIRPMSWASGRWCISTKKTSSASGRWRGTTKNGVARQLVGLEVDWVEVEEQHDKFGLSPAAPSQASRVAVPVYSGDRQVGKATTTAFSPLLKKLIALASVNTEFAKPGTKLQMELTIEAQRMKTTATVVALPFFNPKRKTAMPV